MKTIQVIGAKEHNLQDVSIELPRDCLIVFTGVSGSGKSSLAFDTIYAEAQRAYIESISRYASQYLTPLQKANVQSIKGLSPAIAIDQKSVSHSPRSTVGTTTEIHDYLRVLYARVGTPHCPECSKPIQPQSPQAIVAKILSWPEGERIQILSPIVRGRKGDYNALFAQLRKEGFSRVLIDGKLEVLEDLPETYRLERHKVHDISVVTDRIILKNDADTDNSLQHRLEQSVGRALKKSDGYVQVQRLGQSSGNTDLDKLYWFSTHLGCPDHENIGIKEMAPRLFSFNSPQGACQTCQGLGLLYDVSPDKLIINPQLSLQDGAMPILERLLGRQAKPYLKQVCKHHNISYSTAFNKLSDDQQLRLYYGPNQTPMAQLSEDQELMDEGLMDNEEADAAFWQQMALHFDGVIPLLRRRYWYGSFSEKHLLEQFMVEQDCPTCHGARLNSVSLSVTLGDHNIAALSALTLNDTLSTINQLYGKLDEDQLLIARQALSEITKRLQFLINVGLGYLTLSRSVATLSGGESQRIRLASQIGAGLSGVLYVLDEPSIGLHPENNQQLIETLKHLRDIGNTVIVVEHDEATIRASDWLVDIGPGAGIHGGKILGNGPVEEITASGLSPTSLFLSGQKQLAPPTTTRPLTGPAIKITGASLHNLKNVSATFPLGCLISVTGLSGSGKSSLVFDLLHPLVKQHFGQHPAKITGYKTISGLEHIDKVIEIDQSPIGRTPRSNPATYTGVFEQIRKVFSASAQAKVLGLTPSHFSFNVHQGRCATCKGDGVIKQAMTFLPDVSTLCEACQGKRYKPEVLAAKYKGKSIADVLNLSVSDAIEFFEGYSSITTILQIIEDTGLGYITLGQPSTTLSGGEAQRIKLATELCKRSTGKTLYLLDEPTIGLHWQDMEKLLIILNRLVDAGNTVVVIEHDLDFIKMCDGVIDLGPGAGPDGGEIVAFGTPQQVSQTEGSLTGKHLKRVL